jgi:hypothetical protein
MSRSSFPDGAEPYGIGGPNHAASGAEATKNGRRYVSCDLDLPRQHAAGNTTFQCRDQSQKIRTSDPPVRSIADLAESLMWEFESVLPIAVVTEVIMRLSRNGTVSLDILGNLAWRDLAAMAAERCNRMT